MSYAIPGSFIVGMIAAIITGEFTNSEPMIGGIGVGVMCFVLVL